MKRIVLLTDSLALPRFEPEITYVEDTYPYLLRNHFDVFQFSKGGGVIKELREQAHYYKQYMPDYVIIQSGIVDCAPRAYTYKEETLFSFYRCLRAVKKIISKTITTRRMRRIRRKVWTKLSDYTTECHKIIETFPQSKCYALSILPASTDYEERVLGIKDNIEKYNNRLKEVFGDRFIDLSDIPREYIMTDFHHLNNKGHEFVAKRILETLF